MQVCEPTLLNYLCVWPPLCVYVCVSLVWKSWMGLECVESDVYDYVTVSVGRRAQQR